MNTIALNTTYAAYLSTKNKVTERSFFNQLQIFVTSIASKLISVKYFYFEDIVADTISHCWQTLPKYDNRKELSAFMYIVAKDRMLNLRRSPAYRTETKILKKPLDADQYIIPIRTVEIFDVPQLTDDIKDFEDKDTISFLYSKADDLTKRIIDLMLEGYKKEEISRTLKVNPGIITRRLRKLREFLDDPEPKAETIKRCSRCHKIKSTSEFHACITSADRLYYYCRACCKELYQIAKKKKKENK